MITISKESLVRERLEPGVRRREILLVHTSFSNMRSIMELLDKYY